MADELHDLLSKNHRYTRYIYKNEPDFSKSDWYNPHYPPRYGDEVQEDWQKIFSECSKFITVEIKEVPKNPNVIKYAKERMKAFAIKGLEREEANARYREKMARQVIEEAFSASTSEQAPSQQNPSASSQ